MSGEGYNNNGGEASMARSSSVATIAPNLPDEHWSETQGQKSFAKLQFERQYNPSANLRLKRTDVPTTNLDGVFEMLIKNPNTGEYESMAKKPIFTKSGTMVYFESGGKGRKPSTDKMKDCKRTDTGMLVYVDAPIPAQYSQAEAEKFQNEGKEFLALVENYERNGLKACFLEPSFQPENFQKIANDICTNWVRANPSTKETAESLQDVLTNDTKVLNRLPEQTLKIREELLEQAVNEIIKLPKFRSCLLRDKSKKKVVGILASRAKWWKKNKEVPECNYPPHNNINDLIVKMRALGWEFSQVSVLDGSGKEKHYKPGKCPIKKNDFCLMCVSFRWNSQSSGGYFGLYVDMKHVRKLCPGIADESAGAEIDKNVSRWHADDDDDGDNDEDDNDNDNDGDEGNADNGNEYGGGGDDKTRNAKQNHNSTKSRPTVEQMSGFGFDDSNVFQSRGNGAKTTVRGVLSNLGHSPVVKTNADENPADVRGTKKNHTRDESMNDNHEGNDDDVVGGGNNDNEDEDGDNSATNSNAVNDYETSHKNSRRSDKKRRHHPDATERVKSSSGVKKPRHSDE